MNLLKTRNSSAIFLSRSITAIGAMRALKQYDIKIPEDISIIGLIILETTNYTDPPLYNSLLRQHLIWALWQLDNSLINTFKHIENIRNSKILYLVF